jgi:hypothetical protein
MGTKSRILPDDFRKLRGFQLATPSGPRSNPLNTNHFAGRSNVGTLFAEKLGIAGGVTTGKVAIKLRR